MESTATYTPSTMPVEVEIAVDNLKTATDSMPAKRIKLSSNKTYGSKVTGKFGFIKFIEAYNNVTGQTYEVNPPSPNIHDRIKDYLHLRALEGNNNAFKIQMSRSGQQVDFSTVQGDYAAILGYYDNLGYLERTNPCRHPSFQFYLTGLLADKCREKAKNRFTGSHPLFYEDMKRIIDRDFVESKLFLNKLTESWFKCITVFAYAFMFRIDEVLSLEFQDIEFVQDALDPQRNRVRIQLHDRKFTNYKDAVFTQYRNAYEPELCAVAALEAYLTELQKTGYSNSFNNYLFPKVSNSVMKFTLKQSPSDFAALIFKQVIIDLGLRKGGARHRLIYAAIKWNIDTIRYWCGWSHSKDSGNMGTYLLEELTMLKYENMSQVMCPDNTKLDNTDDQHTQIMQTMKEFREMLIEMKSKLVEVQSSNVISENLNNLENIQQSLLYFNQSPQTQLNFASATTSNPRTLQPLASRPTTPRTPLATPVATPTTRRRGRPKADRVPTENDGLIFIDEMRTVEQVVRFCEIGDPQRNIKPLLNWSSTARNLTPTMKSNYSDKITMYKFFKKLTFGANRVSNALKIRLNSLNISRMRLLKRKINRLNNWDTNFLENTITNELNYWHHY